MAAALVHYSYGEASFGFASGGGLVLSPYDIGHFTLAAVFPLPVVERWRPFSRAFVTSPIGREFDRLTLIHMMDER